MKKTNSQGTLYLAFGILFSLVAIAALMYLVTIKTRANDALQTADVENSSPSVDSLTITDQPDQTGDISSTGFTPNEGTTKTIYAYGTVSDPNGCSDLEHIDIQYSKAVGNGRICFQDNNNCYTTSTTDFQGCTGPGDNDATFNVGVDMANYVDPTDNAGLSELGGDGGDGGSSPEWGAYATVYDQEGAHGNDYVLFNVNSVSAFSVSPGTIDYGTVSLGTTSTQQEVDFTNTGNTDEDTLVHADTDLTSNLSGYDNIPSTNVHVSTTDGFDYETGGHAIQLSDFPLPLGLLQQTDDLSPAPQVPTYFVLEMPDHGVNGTYSNTLYFTASSTGNSQIGGGGGLGPPPGP